MQPHGAGFLKGAARCRRLGSSVTGPSCRHWLTRATTLKAAGLQTGPWSSAGRAASGRKPLWPPRPRPTPALCISCPSCLPFAPPLVDLPPSSLSPLPPLAALARRRRPIPCTCTSCPSRFQFGPPLADLPSSLLSFSASARGPGRGGTAVGRDGPDAPSDGFFWYRIPLRKLHGARGPPSDQTPFFDFVFVFLCRGSS